MIYSHKFTWNCNTVAIWTGKG